MTTFKKINKSYHILVYSQLTTNTAGQSNNCTAYFNFGLLPRSRWKVKYYGAFGAAGFSSNQYPQIFVDFGQPYNEFARNTSNAYPAALKLNKQYAGGLITYTNSGTGCSFNFAATDNGYFYLENTPTSNIFNILVYNHGAGQGLWIPNITPCLFAFAFEQLDDPIYRTIKNVYNVVFNSEYGANNSTTDNSLGTKRYYFDWTRLPEGEYEVSTSLSTSSDQGSTTNFGSFTVFCDLGQGNSTTFTATTLSGAKVSNNNFLSVVFCEQSGSVGPLVCYRDYSPPVFLHARPSNSNVNVYILSTYSGQFYYSKALGINMNYTIAFTFRWLGQKD